jgi:hypothetical protein
MKTLFRILLNRFRTQWHFARQTVRDYNARQEELRKMAKDPQKWWEENYQPAVTDQPKPFGSGADIATLVQKDIEARAQKGETTYGERLKPHNGRDALIDAYQEALDLCMYLRQLIEEKKK